MMTYQPFAETPEIQALGTELRMNVSDAERYSSGALGAGLIAAGLLRGGLVARLPLLLFGGALLWRAWKGHCAGYQRLGFDPRHRHLE